MRLILFVGAVLISGEAPSTEGSIKVFLALAAYAIVMDVLAVWRRQA